ncbi:hypothetical protein CC80DRAFT_489228 [Byssothecium circinans]|uniref:EamA domain-containing protein n=1 Tax=Byssothecium circinans TaxID=147558 RepID=A0A6A5UDL5_9PLEO|nr:hypothetical protein CC80DRAFT_489228 [Byssothecium circinans]
MSYGATNSASTADVQDGAFPQLPPIPDDSRVPERGIRKSLHDFYDRNLGLFLVFLAQTCGSIMNMAAKLLTTSYEVKFHALQIIFIRMSCTTILGVLYMWYHKTPDFPLGARRIRGLLILRGAAGFVGLFGLYYSLTWLEISDATVITFIIPTMTALVCFVWLREPYTLKEALAGFIAFCGVLCVARPTWLFPTTPVDPITGDPVPHALVFDLTSSVVPRGKPPTAPAPISPQQRTLAILMAIMGAFGASIAYATIRVIGKRSHSLISVNYFAGIATVGSTLIILIHPDLHFVVPRKASQWGLIAIIGLAGFLLQFLLTEGLQREKAGRATNLTYLQLVFALVIERVIWGTTPPFQSLVGAALIIGAAVWVSLQKNAQGVEERKGPVDEESRLLGGETQRSED